MANARERADWPEPAFRAAVDEAVSEMADFAGIQSNARRKADADLAAVDEARRDLALKWSMALHERDAAKAMNADLINFVNANVADLASARATIAAKDDLLRKVLSAFKLKDGLWETPGKDLRAEGFTVEEIFELKYGLWREEE